MGTSTGDERDSVRFHDQDMIPQVKMLFLVFKRHSDLNVIINPEFWPAGPALLLALCRPAGPGAPARMGKKNFK